MRARFPRILWASISAELWRLLAVTTAALVTVIAFAAAVKPLADGQIGLGDTLRLMGLLVIPMLQYAIPFAACFASTMCYHRLGVDNEYQAATASGIRHRVLLVPAAMCGAVLALALIVLTSEVIPHSLRAAERIVTRDIGRLIETSVGRGQTIRLGEFDIRAKEIAALPAEASGGAVRAFALFHVLAARADRAGRVNYFVSADRVDVRLFAERSGEEEPSSVQLIFHNATGKGAEGAFQGETVYSHRVRIPNAFREDPKFLPTAELLSVWKRPELLRSIDERRRRLVARMAEQALLLELNERLRGAGTCILRTEDGRTFTISGGGLAFDPERGAWRILGRTEEAPVTLAWSGRTTGAAGRELFQRTRAAWIAPPRRPVDDSFAGLEIRMEHVVTTGGESPSDEGERAEITLRGIMGRTNHAAALDAKSTRALLASARENTAGLAGDDGRSALSMQLDAAARELRDRIAGLRREILSKLHERAAYAASCIVMVILGAVMAIRLKDALPLPVYLWSFGPALVTVISISAGQNMTHNSGTHGLFILWGAVVGLSLLALLEYRRLCRH